MRRAPASSIESFLSEPWWAGVQGILAIAAALAIGITLADFIIRLRDGTPKAVSFTVGRSPVVVNGRVEFSITVRPMGPHLLYEPEWRVWGLDALEIPELPPVFGAADEPESLTVAIPLSKIPDVRIGIAWVVPRRFGSHAAGSRVHVRTGGDYEHWMLYRWRWWPRSTAGRWVGLKSGGRRDPLFIA